MRCRSYLSAPQIVANNIFSLSGQAVQNFSLQGAIVDGTAVNSCSSASSALVTHNPYGQGQTALAGFDLLAEASAANPGSLFSSPILQPLSYLSPSQSQPVAGRVVPLQLTVTNTGEANTTTVNVSSPVGSYIAAADAGTVSGGKLSITLNLGVGESKTIHLWLQTPLGGGQLTVTAVLTASAGNVTAQPVTVTATVNPTVRPGLQAAINDLTTYVGNQTKKGQSPAAQALKELQQASKQLDNGNVQPALSQMVQATDELIQDGSAAIAPIRLEVDEAIYEAELLQP